MIILPQGMRITLTTYFVCGDGNELSINLKNLKACPEPEPLIDVPALIKSLGFSDAVASGARVMTDAEITDYLADDSSLHDVIDPALIGGA